MQNRLCTNGLICLGNIISEIYICLFHFLIYLENSVNRVDSFVLLRLASLPLQVQAPVLLCVGARDRRVSPYQAVEYYRVLQARGIPVR